MSTLAKIIAEPSAEELYRDYTPDGFRVHIVKLVFLTMEAFDSGVVAGDVTVMQETCKDFRRIATKLDAYRRLKERGLRYGEKDEHGNKFNRRAGKRA